MRTTACIAWILILAILGQAALVPPFFLDCVVAIGITNREGTKQWIASGFLYGDLIEKISETESRYRIYLVTNRHIFEGRKKVSVRFNPEKAEPAREYDLLLQKPDGTPTWFGHSDPAIDVAVIQINAPFLKEQGIKFSFFRSERNIADRAKAIELGLTEGDGIYVLGFPLELVGEGRNYVIVRQGNIARIRDRLAGNAKEFLVDAFVFPGNSGGPVITKPEIAAIKGTKSQGSAFLIGMVKGYVPYRDVAVSAQTKRTRIAFEENSGLAVVIPIDYVKETIEQAQALEQISPNQP